MKDGFDVQEILARSTINALLEDAEKKVEWLFEGLIQDNRDKGHQWVITGESKAGKSKLAMQLAVAAVEGKEFLGFKPTKKIRVVYFNFELDRGEAGRRSLAFFGGDKTRMRSYEGNWHVISEWDAVEVLDGNWQKGLKELIKVANPDLIVWDVLRRMTKADENSNVEMSMVMREIRNISSKRTHIVVHHSRKELYGKNGGAKAMRGASSIHAEVDGVLSLASVGKGYTLQFSVRSVPKLDELKLVESGLNFEIEPVKPKVVEKYVDISILFKDEGRKNRGEMLEFFASQLGLADSAADRRLAKYVRSGVLVKEKSGREAMYSLGRKTA